MLPLLRAILIASVALLAACAAPTEEEAGTNEAAAITQRSMDVAKPRRGDLPVKNAYWFARLSEAAYEKDIDAVKAMLPPGDKAADATIFSNESTGTFAFYARYSTFAVVAFRGTDTGWELATTDGDVRLVSWHYGMIHNGFDWALQSIWEDGAKGLVTTGAARSTTQGLRSFLLQRHPYDGLGNEITVDGTEARFPLVLVGHSLGGALATLAYAEATHSKCGRERTPRSLSGLADCTLRGKGPASIDVGMVVSFGSPRVGDADFAYLLGGVAGTTLFRVVNGDDAVAAVPTNGLYSGGMVRAFRHPWLDRDGWPGLIGLRDGRMTHGLQAAGSKGNNFGDHSIGQYVRRLAGVAKLPLSGP